MLHFCLFNRGLINCLFSLHNYWKILMCILSTVISCKIHNIIFAPLCMCVSVSNFPFPLQHTGQRSTACSWLLSLSCILQYLQNAGISAHVCLRYTRPVLEEILSTRIGIGAYPVGLTFFVDSNAVLRFFSNPSLS